MAVAPECRLTPRLPARLRGQVSHFSSACSALQGLPMGIRAPPAPSGVRSCRRQHRTFASSAGSGEGTSKSPLATPTWRLRSAAIGASGASRAAGSPLRAMMIPVSAPDSTWQTSWDIEVSGAAGAGRDIGEAAAREPRSACRSGPGAAKCQASPRRAAMKSSGATSACRRRPAKVPTFKSLCMGMTEPRAPLRAMTWLPLWRAFSKPSLCNAFSASAPETRGV